MYTYLYPCVAAACDLWRSYATWQRVVRGYSTVSIIAGLPLLGCVHVWHMPGTSFIMHLSESCTHHAYIMFDRTKRSTLHATQHEATLHNIAHYVAIPRLVFAGLPLLSAVDRHSLTTCGTVLCICVVREFVLCIDCGSGCRGYAASAAAASLHLLLPLVSFLLLGSRRM